MADRVQQLLVVCLAILLVQHDRLLEHSAAELELKLHFVLRNLNRLDVLDERPVALAFVVEQRDLLAT